MAVKKNRLIHTVYVDIAIEVYFENRMKNTVSGLKALIILSPQIACLPNAMQDI